jgi:starch phosphorylase
MYEDTDLQDEVEARAIFDILEKEAVPLFYDRGPDDLPRGWVELMKNSLVRLCPVFNSNRMVKEYTTGAYLKAHRRHAALMADSMKRAKALAEWKSRIREAWGQVKVERVDANLEDPRVGQALEIKVEVTIGDLDPSDVAIQLHRGPLDQHGSIVSGTTLEMEECGSTDSGVIVCTSAAPLRHSGRQGFTIRVIPRHEDLEDLVDLPLVAWG